MILYCMVLRSLLCGWYASIITRFFGKGLPQNGETDLKITCEGITDDCLVSVQFFTKRKKDQHQHIFCNKNYHCCEVCQMLMSKYEEE